MSRTSISNLTGNGIYLLLTAGPLVAGLIYALLYSLGLTGILADGFTLDHWTSVLRDKRFYHSLLYSLWIALVTMIIAIAISLFLALRYGRLWKRSTWEWGLYIPLAYPAIVAAFIGFHLLSSSGLFSRFAYQTGIIDQLADFPALIQDSWGVGIIIMHSLMAIPFLTLYWLSLYEKEGLDGYQQLSRTLGATATDTWKKVSVPILLKRGKAILILYTIFTAGAYEAPLLMGTQRPQMITIYIVNKINRFDLGDRPQAYAALLITIAIILTTLYISLGRNLKNRQLW